MPFEAVVAYFCCIYIQDASIDPSEVFNRIVSSVCILLSKDEVGFILSKMWLKRWHKFLAS